VSSSLKNWYNSGTNIFQNDQSSILQNHALTKKPLKVQDKMMDFNVIDNEIFINIIACVTLKLLPAILFEYNIKRRMFTVIEKSY
jgi:hypothetical protein